MLEEREADEDPVAHEPAHLGGVLGVVFPRIVVLDLLGRFGVRGKDVDHHVHPLGQDGTGTFYRRNRYVDPMTGRFTQEDPIGLAGGLNLYGFAAGDPVTFSDPFGLCPPGVQALSARDGGNRTTIIVCANKTEEVRHGGTIAWRNNNPGNLRSSENGVGGVRVGGFAVFNTYDEGRDALWSKLASADYNTLTVRELVHKYAPGSDGNDEVAYVDALAGALRPFGMGRNSKTGEMLETSFSVFVQAIQRHEGFEEGTVTYRPVQ